MTPIEQYILQYQKDQKGYEKQSRPLILSVLKTHLEVIVNSLEAGLTPNVDIQIVPGRFVQPILNIYETVGLSAARREYYWQRKLDGMEAKEGILDLFSDAWRAVIRAYATTYAYQVDSDLTETTKNLIRKTLNEAYEEGLNASKIITRIKRVIGATNRYRATNIVRTETTTAANFAKEVGAKKYLEETKQEGYIGWSTRMDERTREAHRIENDTYIRLGEKFILQDPKMGRVECSRPGDLVLPAGQRCHCRCSSIIISERLYLKWKASGRI